MRRLFVLLLAVLAPLSTSAIEIVVGSTPLTIPSPDGYVVVTSGMNVSTDRPKALVPENNVEFASFLSETDTVNAIQGAAPVMTRRFSMQALRSLVSGVFSAEQFGQLKEMLKSQDQKALAEVVRRVPDVEDKVKRGLIENFGEELGMTIRDPVLFRPHAESAQSISFSQLLKYTVTDSTGVVRNYDAVGTTAFVLVYGKVFYLSCFGGKGDLEWTRQASARWVDATMAANPPENAPVPRDPEDMVFEDFEDNSEGASRRFTIALAVAVVVFGFFSWMKRRRSRRRGDSF